jgi:acyl-CoA synthetase (AMP-forming)/AMP-acid ligase II
MANWMNLGEMLKLNAHKYPETICLMDAKRSFRFPETNRRVCQLSNALISLGLAKGDTVSVLLENCIEFIEIYMAAAKTGLVINPVHYRLVGSEITDIVKHADARALIVHEEFRPVIDDIRVHLGIDPGRYVVVGSKAENYIAYDDLMMNSPDTEPDIRVAPEDPWILLYTSGTTGKPKGVVRSHESYIAFYLINAIDFNFRPGDRVLNIMPLCHVNTTYFTFTFTYIGGTTYVHPGRKFDALEVLEIVQKARINFISLIPTHYALILDVPPDTREGIDVSSIKKLLCSSAPARVEQKKAIMGYFRGVELYEAYGSTEAGIVTTSFPEEQLTKPGSIGRESLGTDYVLLLDDDRKPVKRGNIGELYSRGPMMFDGYYKDPERTSASFFGDYFSAGDMAYQDDEGYFYLVDRKNNMIITGGENVFPSEVERVICRHPAVFESAVIGVPDTKWGEAVKAVVILKKGAVCSEQDLIDFCRDKLAGFKRPKSVEFISPEEMPRTGSGKILHRVLRERFS